MVAEFATAIVYVLGAVLYGVLTGLVVKRRQKTWSETILLLLSLSAAMWYLGNAADRSLHLLMAGPLPMVTRLTDVVCCLGLAPLPSLLMVMSILYFHEHRQRLPRGLVALLVAAVCVLVLPFSLVLANVTRGEARLAAIGVSQTGRIFLGWLSLSLTATAWVCFRRARQVTDRREEFFFRTLFWGTAAVAAAIVISSFRMHRGEAAGTSPPALMLMIALAGLFPGVVFSYYVYRYNYLEFVLRRSIFYGFLTLLVISIYYFLIRELGRTIEKSVPGLNVPLVEALMVIGLVYLFPRINDGLRGLLRLVAFRRTANAEQRLIELNRRISLDPMLEAERLFEDVCRRVAEVCGARSVCIVIESDSDFACYGGCPPGGMESAQARAILAACAKAGTPWIERRQVTDVACLAAMRNLGAYEVFPIVQEGVHRGFIAVGGTPVMLPVPEEASDQLVVMANRIASAMVRARMIREKLQLQRRLYAKEKLTSLGQLAASVAHEVRNPLSSIKSLIQCLEEDLARQGIRAEETGLVVEEINRLSRTVSALLRYGRAEANGREEANFREVLDTVLQLLKHELARRGIELQLSVAEGLPAVRAGEDALKEVIFNLLINAVEAMPDGGTLTLTALMQDGRLRACVADTGPGIPPEAIEKVFEPSFTTKPGGTGLGLSIVRDRLEQVGGKVRCRSSSAGTTMELDLPVVTFPSEANSGQHGATENTEDDAGPTG
jgi:signal transduction histidine kinase